MIHYPEPALRIARSGEFDFICRTDHDKFAQQIGKTWLVNPGELLGMKSTPTWGIYDCATHSWTLSPFGVENGEMCRGQAKQSLYRLHLDACPRHVRRLPLLIEKIQRKARNRRKRRIASFRLFRAFGPLIFIVNRL